MSRKNWKQKRNRWHLPGMYLLSFSCSLYTAMARRPREQRESPIFSLPWVLAPLPLSDEESGPKVLLTLEGEESLEEGVGKAAQRSQRRRRRPRLQSCRAGSLGLCVRATARHWARRQRILSLRAAWAPAVGKLAPRVATGTPEPNGGGGSKIDSTVEITPSPNGVSARALGATPSSPRTPGQAPGIFLPCIPRGRLPSSRLRPPSSLTLRFSPLHPSPPPLQPTLPPPAGRDPWRCGAHGAAAG